MPTIQRFLDSDAFIRGLVGPYGSGKSTASIIELGQRGIAQMPSVDGVRRSRWAVIRNTNKELEDTTERDFLQWYPPIHFGEWVPSKHNYTIKALRGEKDDRGAEIEVMFRALDRPDQIRDLLSLQLTGAWINEAREIDWPIVEAVQGRLGRYPRKADVNGDFWFGMWMDTNAPDVGSAFFKFFEETDHTESVAELAKLIPGLTVDTYRQVFKQPSGRSPRAENLENLQLGYYQRLAIGKSEEWIKVYIDGEYGFVIDGKAVWPEYVDALHCPSDKGKWPRPVEGLPIVRSWDFGLTPACIFSQITSRGQWIVFDELVATSMGADAFSDEVIAHTARHYSPFDYWDVGDPAGAQKAQTDERTCFQILQGKGIMIEPGLQTLAIRLESVRKPLRTLVDGRPQFVMHPRCTQLRRAMMGGYHYRRMRISGERYSEQPEKNSYCVPMTTEAMTPRGWRHAEELRAGDAIYGYDMGLQRLVRTEISAVNIFPGETQVIRWANDFSSFTSTAAHRNVAWHRTGALRIVDTADLNSAHSLLCAASEDRHRKERPFSDEFISLAAWVAAEGSYRQHDDAILLSQSAHHNPAYCRYLDRLLAAFPGTIAHETDEWGNPQMRSWRIMRETAWLLRYWMPDKVPSPAFIAAMCNSNRRRFLYEFLRGDGTAGGVLPDPGDLGRARDFAPHKVAPIVTQKRIEVIDALQMMATLSGIRTRVTPMATNGFPGWRMGIRSKEPRFGIASKSRVSLTVPGVWCPTTPTGTWVCRQAGETFITGNSHPADALGYAGTRLFGAGLYQPRHASNDRGSDNARSAQRNLTTGY